MTALQITPNWKNKTAKFKGTIAAGEHVAVSIANDDNFIADTTNLRLRVVNPANGKTLAQFPMPETADDETDGENEVLPSSEIPAEGEVDWASDLTPLFCILNLNTAQMLKAVPPAANMPLLFVLDAYKEASDGDPGEFTLYFKDMCEVTHWPRRTGEEQPVNLDDYKDLIEDFNTRLTDAEQTVADAAANAQSAANSASAAAQSAATASTAATDAQTGAIASKNAAQSAATAAATSATNASTAAANAAQAASGAQNAQSAAEAAAARAEAALPLDTTLSLVGKAADAKSVGDALALKANKSDTYTKSETDSKVADEAQARTLLAATVQANAETIATHTSSLASLSSRVGDNETAIADRYTKGEVDAKVAGVQTFQKLVVNELPSAEAADDKTIYLVPRAGSETPDLCDEYVTVGAAGSRRWEKIGGGTAVDITLDDAVTRTSTNGVKSSGIWSAIWGALTALPGFSSLYDWCVAQLAGKASTADATLTPIYSDTPTFSAWTISPSGKFTEVVWNYDYGEAEWLISFNSYPIRTYNHDPNAISVSAEDYDGTIYTATRTRTDIIGYQLGSQTDKPLQPKGNYALLSDIYAAVRQIAPDFTAKAYVRNELCTYNGVVYRCNSAYTATASSTKPDADTTHWEAKPVSDLFLRAAHLVTEVASESRQFADVPGVVVFNPNGVSYLSRLSELQLMTLLQNGGVVDAFGNAMCFPTRSATSNEIYNFALTAGSGHTGNLAALDASGNPTDSGKKAADFAPLASPAFTGTPTAPTPNAQSADIQIANKKYVDDAVAGGGGGNLDYVMRVDPETGGIYYTTPDTNA